MLSVDLRDYFEMKAIESLTPDVQEKAWAQEGIALGRLQAGRQLSQEISVGETPVPK